MEQTTARVPDMDQRGATDPGGNRKGEFHATPMQK